MKCEYHPNVDSIEECSNCLTPLCGICANFESSSVLCNSCAESRANSKFVNSQNSRSAKLERMMEKKQEELRNFDSVAAKKMGRGGNRERIHMVLLSLALAFIAFRLYFSFGAGSMLTPSEVLAEDRLRDQIESCVFNFWQIAELLQDDLLPGEALNCEGAGGGNIVTRVGDDIIVRHPNPELLGYSEIVVSKNSPIPVLVDVIL